MFTGDRPVFDFDGALEAAKRLAGFADEYRDTLASRYEARNSALNEWDGDLADNFSVRADDENQSAINVLLGLRQESSLWNEAWVKAVTIMNNVLYSEAVAAQKNYRERQDSERGFFGQAWDGIDNFVTGSDTVYEEVPKPREPEIPGDKDFTSAVFADYERSGDEFDVSYVSHIPAAPHGEG